jgi:hypothetical protein
MQCSTDAVSTNISWSSSSCHYTATVTAVHACMLFVYLFVRLLPTERESCAQRTET